VGGTLAHYALVVWRDRRATHRSVGTIVLNVSLEFGVAEAADTLVTRPLLLVAATHVVRDVAFAVIVGKVAADVVFFVPAIIVYELR
jgi:hypothetical protein